MEVKLRREITKVTLGRESYIGLKVPGMESKLSWPVARTTIFPLSGPWDSNLNITFGIPRLEAIDSIQPELAINI